MENLLTKNDVIAILKPFLQVSRHTICNMIKDGTLPKPMRPTGKRGDLRWTQAQIDCWLAGLQKNITP